MLKRIGLLAGLMLAVFAGPAAAASLQVSPVTLEPRGAASVINLRNDSDKPIKTQIRVMRWNQAKGRDELVPTRDVVASPPAATVAPGADYVIRIVRVKKQPLGAEETYRVLVDQLPEKVVTKGTNVNFLMRYSVPVFFNNGETSAARVDWQAILTGGKLVLRANNPGDRRVKLTSLKVEGPSGPILNVGEGLVGYVLGGSANTIVNAKAPKGVKPGTQLRISATSESGPVGGSIIVAAQ